ncbi:MAG: DinB family protein [Acidobacteriota bacterium]
MSSDADVLESTVSHALSGKGAHIEAVSALEGLDWKLAGSRPHGAPYSIFELLSHIIYWQDWVVKWLDGKEPPIPKHASGSWPVREGPRSAEEWEKVTGRFKKGLDELNRRSREQDLLSKQRKKTPLKMLHTIASHNSYHLGQVALLRRISGGWPPPSGGLTW